MFIIGFSKNISDLLSIYLPHIYSPMKKILLVSVSSFILGTFLYVTANYYMYYSEGYRAGQLTKFSKKGLLFKTYEGQISQGVSDSQIFTFSVEKDLDTIISQLELLQGRTVRLKYKERFTTFPWWGDSHYFITSVEKVNLTE